MIKERTCREGRLGKMRENRWAFTLIELLVVIAIIGLLAGLLIPLAGIATTKMKVARVSAELNGYVTAIESYKLEVGSYPPDHGDLRRMTRIHELTNQYRTNCALNPLFYELSGAVFTNKQFRTVVDNEVITTNDLYLAFKREGIVNSARTKFDVPYKGFSPKPAQFNELNIGQDVEILVVPTRGPMMIPGRVRGNPNATNRINPWFYDASSTNRHNRATYDLWAEIIVGGETTIIGNWKN